MYLPVRIGATVYFAQPDALKVSKLYFLVLSRTSCSAETFAM